MKKLFISILFSLFFISCLDYTQYVTIDENDNISVIAIATISKSMIELAALSEGYEDTVPVRYYDEILSDMEKEAKSSYPRNFKFKRINNDNEIGLYINGTVKKSDLKDSDSYLLPVRTGNKFMFTPFDNSENTSEYNEYSSMLSSMKMKLIVSKSYIPTISACYISSYDELRNINVYDLKDSFLIELPIFADISNPILYIEL
ncbi:hypothetical protein [Brachyspira alvinipulli]|uniref:hypothetical protein n=1 Tax=Brachyspira alvinipulli TaxID=84379 RepID=UPI000481C4C3|nr:hypothetical protein [Brachyspira alvinipulli]